MSGQPAASPRATQASSHQTPVREQLLIERDVQSALLFRASLYGTSLAVYFTVIQFFTQSMQNPEVGGVELLLRFFDEAIYWGPGLMLLGPLIAYDMLKLSNRFAGPIFSLRREMKRLINRDSKGPLNFRDDDFWADLSEPFNELREELLQLRRMVAESATQEAAADDASPSSEGKPPTGNLDHTADTESQATGDVKATDAEPATV